MVFVVRSEVREALSGREGASYFYAFAQPGVLQLLQAAADFLRMQSTNSEQLLDRLREEID